MPPKVKFTKKEVVRAAVTVVEKKGLKSLTARNAAAALKSSTAPVYHHFANMDELARMVIKETQKTLLDYTRRSYTDRVFLNMGTGICTFACEHQRLYRALMLEGDSFGDVVEEILSALERAMIKDKRFVLLPASERRTLLRKMWTFTHGLASLISVGLIKNCSLEYIINTLTEVGTDVIGATLARHAKDIENR